jgi:polyhydroxyalkanoate synthase subunit PhaC
MMRPSEPDRPKDKRFKHSDWTENAVFNYVKESYLVAAKSILSAVRDVKGVNETSARKVDFYTRQFVDAISPSNFVATNPEVLKATLDTGGQNLLHGLENLLSDLGRGNGRLWVAKYKSGGDRSLKQTAAMLPPRVTVKRGWNS